MTRTLATTSCIVACAFLMGAAAQTPQPSTGKAEEKTVTITGCLATGDQPDTFKLTNIEKSGQQTLPASMMGVLGLREALQLVGTDAAKLKQHVGHTVAVTGMLVPRKEGQAAGDPTQKRPAMSLNVKSFKHVETTCPPAK